VTIFRTPALLRFFFPNLLWRVPTESKQIYLTFDDGPVPGPTEFVLDQLNRCNAKATFFCIGDNVFKYPSIFSRIVNEGHAIGNHTFNHLKGWGTSTEKYVANVELCDREISRQYTEKVAQSLTDYRLPKTNLFRPPYGRIRSKQIHTLESKYKIVMWDVLTSDYNQALSPENCLKGSLRATRPGSIVVFHDSLKAEKNLRYVLPRFLEQKMQEGFVFKALSEPGTSHQP
jgi:peptidoglycan-N-acetylglucosamine deacetylase